MGELREFDARADVIGAMRGYVQDALVRHGAADEAIDAAVLCTSELATNALLHGDGPISLVLDLTDRARVAVGDRNERPPVRISAEPDDDIGRGLMLVTLFADDWGYERADDGKTVWFEIDLREREPGRRSSGERRRGSDLSG